MKFNNPKYLNQISQASQQTPEILPETETQGLTETFLTELRSALNWQKRTLAEAAQEIQLLLRQIEEHNPTATEAEKQNLITSAISANRRERFLNALQAGWQEMIQEFLDHPYTSLGIATLERWQKGE
ncbi:hypothetical protein [Lyngbya aestuarii]|uniref:hypothetical protein n=1 Tax=Lyngbya aestuarii TaxID=118322 RepID=UPI00403DFDDE